MTIGMTRYQNDKTENFLVKQQVCLNQRYTIRSSPCHWDSKEDNEVEIRRCDWRGSSWADLHPVSKPTVTLYFCLVVFFEILLLKNR